MRSWLIFGLGNPGREYEFTYHNVGLIALGYIKRNLEEEAHSPVKSAKNFVYWKYSGLTLATSGPEGDIFMNHSGIAVKEALGYLKFSPEELIVLHDDSDLAIGEYKLEKGRGAAGHHGVESIIEALGTNEFWRGRIGIRPKEEARRRKAEEFVLKNINKKDEPVFADVFEKVSADIRSGKFAG